MDLPSLHASLKDCQLCRLSKGRSQVVFGTGNPNAEIMFVGEAPGFYEDRQGEPFVGAAGKLLNELLQSIGLTRSDIFIANVIKCRPPNNRDPLPDEIDTCKPFLLQQIQLINPKLVCTLGNFATQTLLERKVGITKVRGQVITRDQFLVFPLLHPAAAGRRTADARGSGQRLLAGRRRDSRGGRSGGRARGVAYRRSPGFGRAALGISRNTVVRELKMARAWLLRAIDKRRE